MFRHAARKVLSTPSSALRAAGAAAPRATGVMCFDVYITLRPRMIFVSSLPPYFARTGRGIRQRCGVYVCIALILLSVVQPKNG